jgi:hypothetical protein
MNVGDHATGPPVGFRHFMQDPDRPEPFHVDSLRPVSIWGIADSTRVANIHLMQERLGHCGAAQSHRGSDPESGPPFLVQISVAGSPGAAG